MATTGWTFTELDEQDVRDIDAHLDWMRIRSGVEKQYRSMRR